MRAIQMLSTGALALVDAFARSLPATSTRPSRSSFYPELIRTTNEVSLGTSHSFVFKTTKGARHRSQRIRSNRRKAQR